MSREKEGIKGPRHKLREAAAMRSEWDAAAPAEWEEPKSVLEGMADAAAGADEAAVMRARKSLDRRLAGFARERGRGRS